MKFCEPIHVFDEESTNPKQLFYQSSENSESPNSQNDIEESESENFSKVGSQELEDKSISSDTSLNSVSIVRRILIELFKKVNFNFK